MKYKNQNPVCSKGQRNIYCPFYAKCLDHAVIQKWEFWSCGECECLNVQGAVHCDQTPPENADPYYSVSPSIQKKAGSYSV